MKNSRDARRTWPPLVAWRRLTRYDRLSSIVLVLLPVLLDAPFTLAGKPLMPGDDLTQNYPLRVFVGEVIRSGHLPGWDPFIWSGTPLLAGWNAGAMFPGTWLFALLPGPLAWTVNLVLVGAVCGTGLYALLRRLGCRELASLLAALVFTYTGFMSGQIVHIGLVEGTACMPWMLVALDGLAGASGSRVGRANAGREVGPRARGGWSGDRPSLATAASDSRRMLGWIVLLAVTAALTVLGGDPRAVSTSGVVVAIFGIACWWRARGSARRLVGGVLAAAALGAALSALQWLPGIAFLHASQRGVSAYTFFGGGSLGVGQIGGLLVLPFALGGNGDFGLPVYFGNYNLPELTIGVGLVALVAAFALLPDWIGSLTRRRPAGDAGGLGVWYVVLLVGIALTLGTKTPLGHLLVHIPLYSGERLQNRNAAIIDVALCVLLAFFLDDLLGRAAPQRATRPHPETTRRGDPLATKRRRAFAVLPIAWLTALVACAYIAPSALESMVGVARPVPDLSGLLAPYLLATLALGIAVGVVVIGWPRIKPRAREIALVALVLADVATYVTNATWATVPTSVLGAATPLSKQLAARTSGRFAIYNPSYLPASGGQRALEEIGITDLNLLRHISSVQGYGSIVRGAYQNATNTHEFEGLDQTQLRGGTFDSLDLATLLTLPGYLQQSLTERDGIPVAGAKPVTATGAPAAQADTPAVLPHSTGPWTLRSGGTATWLLASTDWVTGATVVVNAGPGDRPNHVVVGLQLPGGSVHRYSVAVSNGIAELRLPVAERAEAVLVENPTTATAVVGAVVATTRAPDERLLLNGELQGALPSPHWQFAGALGPFVTFDNTRARGAAWLEPLGSTTATSPTATGGTVTTGATLETGSQTMHVETSRPALLVRSQTFAGGWTARITPVNGGRTVVKAVHEIGLVQAVEIPAGRYTITWRYAPGSLLAGLVLSILGTVAALALIALSLVRSRGSGGLGRRSIGPSETLPK